MSPATLTGPTEPSAAVGSVMSSAIGSADSGKSVLATRVAGSHVAVAAAAAHSVA